MLKKTITLFLALTLGLTGCRSFNPNDLMPLTIKTDEGVLSETKIEIKSDDEKNVSNGVQYFVEQHNKQIKSEKYVLKIKSKNNNDTTPVWILLPSIFTFGLPQVFGIPFFETAQVDLTGEIYYHGTPVKKYIASGKKDWSVVSCWYGYFVDDAHNKAETLSFKEAYTSLLNQVVNDNTLKQKFAQAKKEYDKKIAAQKAKEAARKKALEEKKAEEARQKAIADQKKAAEKKIKLKKIRANLGSTGCKNFNKTMYELDIFGKPGKGIKFGNWLAETLYKAQEKHPGAYIKCEYGSMEAAFNDGNMSVHLKIPGHPQKTFHMKQEDDDIFYDYWYWKRDMLF